MFASIFGSVLVLAAVGNAALALTIWWRLTRRMDGISEKHAQTCTGYNRLLAQLSAKLNALQLKAPEALAAQVADLAEAVARLRATHQRFAGRFDATRGRVFDGATGEPLPDDDDDEIAAMVGLQTAPPAKPTNGAP